MNFVSQCLHAGGMPIKQQGFLWYGAKSGSSASWKGVDSFLAYIRQSFGSPRLLFECYATPENLKRGTLFSVLRQEMRETFLAILRTLLY